MQWVVNQGGYEIGQPNAPEDLKLRQYVLGLTPPYRFAKAVVPKEGEWQSYNPFEVRGGSIAREFANIPLVGDGLDEKAVIEFSNNYGLLGLGLSDGKQEERLEDWKEKVLMFKAVFTDVDRDGGDFAGSAFNIMDVHTRMKLEISPGDRKWERSLEMTPATLYDAMWLMAVGEITMGAQMQPCEREGCSKWFAQRRNKKYCSDICRVYGNRQISKQSSS
ncbi:MAG: hypothetical protein R3D66_04700 [Alphaproteobacteria bacterium]